jgi:CheY-like chemotaxis protein/anti-sigma regulatory factor (Ser/Thr protein kinase)
MPTVLVVDDSSVDRSRIGGLLLKAELNVEYAVNGAEALRRIAEVGPDLVLTDLIMPEMDGLELVAAVVAQFPLIPVILMTGRGNEETAVRALRAGATSYVPKSMLQTFLLETVQSVLNAAEQEQCEIRLFDCLRRSDTTFQLRNDVNMIAPLVNHLHRTIRAIGVCDHTCGIRVSVALEEAINNAMFHGNLEITSAERTGDREAYRVLLADRLRTPPYCERTVGVQAKVSPEEAVFIIRDQGPGFDPNNLPDPTDPENLEKASGRGLLLMRTFMDSVEFNRAGNEVIMIKRLETEDSDE